LISIKIFSAIFFTQNGILLNAEKLPFHPFFDTKEKLNLSWDSICLDEGILIVKAAEGCELPKSFLDEFTISPPKSILGAVPTPVLHIVLRAIHWVTWSEKMSFCSSCGSKLSNNVQSAKKQCMSCKQIFYPNLAPAVMVLIHKGNEVLLVRSPHFKPGVYGAIAGFIDSGETAEVAAGREVKEEVGLEITNLTYFETQSCHSPIAL
jgi:NAD+ diphosphatase